MDILYEHPDWWAINKPSGVPVQDKPDQLGILHALGQLGPLHLVHRLDQGTSGVLLLARSPAAAETFRQRFASGEMNKQYWAVTTRKPSKKQGWVVGDQVKTRNGSWKLTTQKTNPARTQFISSGLGNGQRALCVRPLTGRTHQIRVAMKALGAPLLGDLRYGGAPAARLYLHARRLSFTWQDKSINIVAPLTLDQWPMLPIWPKEWLFDDANPCAVV